ncbi:MAG: D-fructose 1,6-bisphosphatase [Candidatus Methanomethyliales bacterium]|nr:D-fructose 1,6-bisphosphatase [Candidatus Methanomethylicales archaeon]
MSLRLLEGLCKAEMEAIAKVSPQSSSKIVKIGAGGDKTKLIDLVAEEAAVSYLKLVAFEGRLISEELGERQFGNKEYPILILDPIDGTTNAVRGIIPYSISAALSYGSNLSDIFAGIVMELPTGRTYRAVRGEGAYLDDQKISVNRPAPLRHALIGIDVNVRRDRKKIEQILPLLMEAKHIRVMGTAALELCYVASGGLDLYVDNRNLLRITDIAASYIILKEAGASILRLDGSELDSPLSLSERVSLVAGNYDLCIEALSKIKRL